MVMVIRKTLKQKKMYIFQVAIDNKGYIDGDCNERKLRCKSVI